VAGTLYHFAVDGFGGESGSITLNWSQNPERPPENDQFADRLRLHGEAGALTATNLGATREPGEPDHAGGGGTKSIWWSWVAPGEGLARFHTAGSSFDTLLAVYIGSRVDALSLVAENDDDDDTGELSSDVTFRVNQGTEFQIAVDGFGGEAGLVMLAWSFFLTGETTPFRRGDVLDDGAFNLTDAILTLNYLFLAGAAPSCLKSADVDDSGEVNLTDAVSLLNHLFLEGPEPAPPLASCGRDPTPDDLGCGVHRVCPR
jgi:hypothetical protein